MHGKSVNERVIRPDCQSGNSSAHRFVRSTKDIQTVHVRSIHPRSRMVNSGICRQSFKGILARGAAQSLGVIQARGAHARPKNYCGGYHGPCEWTASGFIHAGDAKFARVPERVLEFKRASHSVGKKKRPPGLMGRAFPLEN